MIKGVIKGLKEIAGNAEGKRREGDGRVSRRRDKKKPLRLVRGFLG